jgi:hypothetical protein
VPRPQWAPQSQWPQWRRQTAVGELRGPSEGGPVSPPPDGSLGRRALAMSRCCRWPCPTRIVPESDGPGLSSSAPPLAAGSRGWGGGRVGGCRLPGYVPRCCVGVATHSVWLRGCRARVMPAPPAGDASIHGPPPVVLGAASGLEAGRHARRKNKRGRRHDWSLALACKTANRDSWRCEWIRARFSGSRSGLAPFPPTLLASVPLP